MVYSEKIYQAAKEFRRKQQAGKIGLTPGVTKRIIGGTVEQLPDGTTITTNKYIYEKDGVAVVDTETSTKTPIYTGSSSKGHDIKPVTEVTEVTNPMKETVIQTNVNAGSSIQRSLGYKPKSTETTKVKIGSEYYTKIGKGDKAVYFSDKPEYYGDRNILQKQTSKSNELKFVTPLNQRVVPIGSNTDVKYGSYSEVKGFNNKLAMLRSNAISKSQYDKNQLSRTFQGIVVLGALGAVRGGYAIVDSIRHPIRTALSIVEQIKHPIQTIEYLGKEFVLDPVGTVAEFYTFNKGLKLIGTGVRKSPVGRFVQEELYIRSQPKEFQPYIRKILQSAKVQEAINPYDVKTIKKVDFLEVKTLNKIEAVAIDKTLRQTDSVVFGSLAGRTLSRKESPIPKDVDLATSNVKEFSKKFIENIPSKYRSDYYLKGQKIYRKSTKTPIFDVKPLERLIPNRTFKRFGKGELPISSAAARLKLTKRGLKYNRKPSIELIGTPTQKIVKVGGIKLTSFGEQTTRKAFGTIQVIIERNFKRAKDPQSFVKSLEIQLKALRKNKPKNPISKLLWNRKIDILDKSIKVFKSGKFSQLLNKSVKGLTKEYPIIDYIKQLKKKKVLYDKIEKNNKQIKQIRKKITIVRQTNQKKRLQKLVSSILQKNKDLRKKILYISYLPVMMRDKNFRLKYEKQKASKLQTKKISNKSYLPTVRIIKGGSYIPIPRSKASILIKSNSKRFSFSIIPPSKPSRLDKAVMSKLSIIQSALRSAYQSSNFKNSKLSKVNFSKLPMSKKIQYIKTILKIAKLKYKQENRKVYKSQKGIKKSTKKYIFTPTILGIFTKKGKKKGTRLGFTGIERRYR